MAAMTAEDTRTLALAFAHRPDPAALAADAVFAFAERDDATGRETLAREVGGREAVVRALDWFYRHAGTVHTPAVTAALFEGRVMLEIAFYGRDLGGFFGLATAPEPTIVPCAMVLTMEDNRIATGYLTFDLELLRRRVGARRA